MSASNVLRTRFAPSPTGHLHIGNARTALFNWLLARQRRGSFILRIEDTDIKRSKAPYELSLMEDLRWMGLLWDEGPDISGPAGRYRQSERVEIYLDYAERLLEMGMAYRCYCDEERLRELRKRQLAEGKPPRYDGRCREVSKAKKDHFAIRFKVPERDISFADAVHGVVEFNRDTFGDFIIVGSDKIASYNFAAVIDDALMGITHVIRGEDHLPNTPRQILLLEALEIDIPVYAHIPLVLGADRAPLGKRNAVAAIRDLREKGFLKEAVINHLCHLGWSPQKRLLSIEEAIEEFALERLSRSPSVFDIKMLERFNRDYIVRSGLDSLVGLIRPYLSVDVEDKWLRRAIDAVRGDARTLRDIPILLAPFLKGPEYDEEALEVLKKTAARRILRILLKEIENRNNICGDAYKEIILSVKKRAGTGGRNLFLPIRAALTGSLCGIEIDKVFTLLDREKIIERLKRHI